MLTCDAADALIVQEADGVIAGHDRERLAAHVSGCDRCRERRAANVAVRRVLAARPDGDVRADFLARVAAGVAPTAGPAWLPEFDWRRWTAWTLPVTAALMLVAGYAGLVAPTTSAAVSAAETASTTTETAAAIETWMLGSDAGSSSAASALSPDVSSDDLLAGMVVTTPAAGAEGQRDGR